MGDYDAPPHERIENVRADRDQAQRLAITLARQLDEARAAFAIDLAAAEAEYERLASAARALLDAVDDCGPAFCATRATRGEQDALRAALGED